MKQKELEKELKKAGIPENLYNLDGTGRTDERFCLENINNKWYVYFIERGIKTLNEEFESEDGACQFIYKQLLD